jgi:hypothetical protein
MSSTQAVGGRQPAKGENRREEVMAMVEALRGQEEEGHSHGVGMERERNRGDEDKRKIEVDCKYLKSVKIKNKAYSRTS